MFRTVILGLLILSLPFLQIVNNAHARETYSSMNCFIIARGKVVSFDYDYAHANKRGLPMTYDSISFHFNPGTCFCIGRAGICRMKGDISAGTSKGYFIGLIFPVKATGNLVIIGVAYKITVTRND